MYEPLQCRNLSVNGRRTSMRLEPMMWALLEDIVRREKTSMNALVSSLERRMEEKAETDLNLTATVRLFVMQYYKAAATEDGHRRAGHGEGDPFAGMDLKPAISGERRRVRPPADDGEALVF